MVTMMRSERRLVALTLLFAATIAAAAAFITPPLPGRQENVHHPSPIAPFTSTLSTSSSSTVLFAVPALVKRAKKQVLKQYAAAGVPEDVMAVYRSMMEKVKENNDKESTAEGAAAAEAAANTIMGPLQDAITRRKGTLTVIAEFRRKRETQNASKAKAAEDAAASDSSDTAAASSTATPTGDSVSLNLDPEVLSPIFRSSGVSGIAVLADDNVGGCSYDDLDKIVTEQSRAHQQVPGPVIVINSDVIIDELQLAVSKVAGVGAVLVSLSMNGVEQTQTLLQCCKAVDLECIVSVETSEEAQQAVDLGAAMIMVTNVDGADAKQSVISNLTMPEASNNNKVSLIANIRAYNDNQWLEVEEAWAIRDKGFHCAWVGDALYKSGTDVMETPAAIIKAMKSKSSVKWASPKVYTGKGEGAREYLGDILM